MSLWGNKEVKLIGGTLGTGGATGVTVTGVGTTFLTDVKNGDVITSGAVKKQVIKVNSNTSLTLSGPAYIAAGSTGVYVSQKPKFLSDTGYERQSTVYGVDTVEAVVNANKGAGHAGWVKVTVGTGGRSGRKIRETLVAMGVTPAVMGDAENTIYPNS